MKMMVLGVMAIALGVAGCGDSQKTAAGETKQAPAVESPAVINGCMANRRSIVCACEAYEIKNLKAPSSVADLTQDGLLKSVPICPGGGDYTLTVDVNHCYVVTCSKHGKE